MLGSITLSDIRCDLFLTGLIVYAVFGSPTPDNITWVEVLIGACLLLSAQPLSAFHYMISGLRYGRPSSLLLIYGISIPVLFAAVYGHNPNNIIRDFIPFLYFLIPIFYVPLFKDSARRGRALLGVTLLVGLCFAWRTIPDIWFQSWGAAWPEQSLINANLLYLANAPTVLFTATALMGWAGFTLYQRVSLTHGLAAAGLIILAILPLVAMAMMLQRASFAWILLSFGLWLACVITRKPTSPLSLIFFGIFLYALSLPFANLLVDKLVQKNDLVGSNMRIAELFAVYTTLAEHPFGFLFGMGWGAPLNSPAVGGLAVNFTHSLLTSMWLKTGVIGVSLTLLYGFGFLNRLYTLLNKNILLAMALAGPFFINIFLYASYKSLDFGLILLLIAVLARSELIDIHKPLVYVRSNDKSGTSGTAGHSGNIKPAA